MREQMFRLHRRGLIADVGTADGNWRMVEAALERHGPLGILILNAGARAMKPVADYAEEDGDKLTDLMVKARADWPVESAPADEGDGAIVGGRKTGRTSS